MNDPVIKKILVPLDFSEVTMSVIEHAIYLARLLGAEVWLLHVVHVPPLAEASTWLDPVISPTMEQDIRQQMKTTAEAKLKELAQEFASQGIKAEAAVREGLPFAEIIKFAEENKSDLIVMGSHGRSGLSHLLIGSVAERVVRRARCNILCVKPKPIEENKPAG